MHLDFKLIQTERLVNSADRCLILFDMCTVVVFVLRCQLMSYDTLIYEYSYGYKIVATVGFYPSNTRASLHG